MDRKQLRQNLKNLLETNVLSLNDLSDLLQGIRYAQGVLTVPSGYVYNETTKVALQLILGEKYINKLLSTTYEITPYEKQELTVVARTIDAYIKNELTKGILPQIVQRRRRKKRLLLMPLFRELSPTEQNKLLALLNVYREDVEDFGKNVIRLRDLISRVRRKIRTERGIEILTPKDLQDIEDITWDVKQTIKQRRKTFVNETIPDQIEKCDFNVEIFRQLYSSVSNSLCALTTCNQRATLKLPPNTHLGDSVYCSQEHAKQHWDSIEASTLKSSFKKWKGRKSKMQQLWIEHVDYTHNVIVAIARNLPKSDLNAYLGRLMKNQTEIAKLMKSNQLEIILKEHITIAGQILISISKGDGQSEDYIRNWRMNGEELADKLYSITDFHLTREALGDAINTHLDQTLSEATYIFNGNMEMGIEKYDEARQHMIHVAKLLYKHSI